MSRRIAAAILGSNRPGNQPSAVAHQRRLPLGRRLLTSVLGIQARPSASSAFPRNEPKVKAKAPHTDSTSCFVPPPNTPSPPPRAQHHKGRSQYTGGSVRKRTPSEGRQEYGSRWAGSVPQHLLSEDRQEYERILDEVLRSAPHRPELAAVGQRLNSEQLRTMALNATAIITAAAATEYQHYIKVREELRRPSASATPAVRESGSSEPEPGTAGLAADMGEVHETSGAGAVAVVAVLTPVLTGAIAVLSLLVGFILKTLVPKSVFAQIFLTIGWISGAVAGAAVLVAAAALLLTALRNRPSLETGPYDELGGEVARARDAWHEALLERGIMPFLRDALTDPGTAAALRYATPSEPTSRIPNLGYHRPGFTSPDEGPTPRPRPRFTSPDFAGPAESGPSTGPENSD
jgi:hypothetical protein